ncbi:MAG: GNAT family N-acetyltransferase [Acidobacteriota bacterium]
MSLEPVVLQGSHVRLEPLTHDHFEDLVQVALDPEIWRWTTERVRSHLELRAWIDRALAARDTGTAMPFATVALPHGKAIGGTRFATFSKADRRVEIGWTWIGRDWQRTAVNTEAKYLMLRHAFETLGCIRVELRTDVQNERSRAAIRRIGAKEEGVLRKHSVTATGRVRDTVYYSILGEEWPGVKAGLDAKLDRASVPRTSA